MPNEVKPWSEISKNFDPMMPAEQYDGLRLKYFSDFVAPKVERGKSVDATWTKFKEMTERPSLLGPGGKAMLHVKLGAAAAADAMVAPLAGVSPGVKKLQSAIQETELGLVKMGEREGMNTKIPLIAGSFAGQAIDFGVISSVLGPEVGLLAREMTSSAKGAELLTRTLR